MPHDNLYQRKGTWYARFAINGEIKRYSLRTSDLREAKKRLKGCKEQVDRQAFGVADAPTWNDAVVAYNEGVLKAGSVKDSTAKRYDVSLRQLGVYFAGKKLPAITIAEVTQYVSARQKLHTSNATIRRDLTTMSRVLAYARTRGLVQANVVDDYDRSLIRERRAAIEAPTDDIVKAVFEALNPIDQQMAAIIHFLRATGMRTGEAIRAKAEHRHGNDLLIPETKNGRPRTIRLTDEIISALPAKGPLFPGVPQYAAGLSVRWRGLRSKLPEDRRFRLHDLRHAYAIGELRAGRDIYDLSHHLGHSSVQVTEIYLGYVAGGRAHSRR